MFTCIHFVPSSLSLRWHLAGSRLTQTLSGIACIPYDTFRT